MSIPRIAIVLALVATPAVAAGQDLKISPVVLEATLAEPPASAKGYLRLMALKRDLTVSVLAGELKTTGATIARNTITLPAEAVLKQGQPKDLVVQIDGIRYAGAYTGTIEIYVNDSSSRGGAPQPESVSVTLTVSATPKLALVGTQPIVWTLVRCTQWQPCALIDALLPPAMDGNIRTVHIEDSRKATKVADGVFFTTASSGADTKATVTVKPETGLSGAHQFKATADFTRADLVPGVYPAILRIKSEAEGDPLSLPVSVDVRAGPLLALVAIIAGIAVGRLAQKLATPLFQFQSGLLTRVNQIRRSAEGLAEPGLKALLLERLTSVIDRLEMATAPDPTITAVVDAVANQTITGQRFDRITVLVSKVTDDGKRRDLERQLAEILALIPNGDLKDVDARLNTVEAATGVRVARGLRFGPGRTKDSDPITAPVSMKPRPVPAEPLSFSRGAAGRFA